MSVSTYGSINCRRGNDSSAGAECSAGAPAECSAGAPAECSAGAPAECSAANLLSWSRMIWSSPREASGLPVPAKNTHTERQIDRDADGLKEEDDERHTMRGTYNERGKRWEAHNERHIQ